MHGGMQGGRRVNSTPMPFTSTLRFIRVAHVTPVAPMTFNGPSPEGTWRMMMRERHHWDRACASSSVWWVECPAREATRQWPLRPKPKQGEQRLGARVRHVPRTVRRLVWSHLAQPGCCVMVVLFSDTPPGLFKKFSSRVSDPGQISKFLNFVHGNKQKRGLTPGQGTLNFLKLEFLK